MSGACLWCKLQWSGWHYSIMRFATLLETVQHKHWCPLIRSSKQVLPPWVTTCRKFAWCKWGNYHHFWHSYMPCGSYELIRTNLWHFFHGCFSHLLYCKTCGWDEEAPPSDKLSPRTVAIMRLVTKLTQPEKCDCRPRQHVYITMLSTHQTYVHQSVKMAYLDLLFKVTGQKRNAVLNTTCKMATAIAIECIHQAVALTYF